MKYQPLVRNRDGRWTRKTYILNAKVITSILLVGLLITSILYYAHKAYGADSTVELLPVSGDNKPAEYCLTTGAGTGRIESYCGDNEAQAIQNIKWAHETDAVVKAKMTAAKWTKAELIALIEHEAKTQGYADVKLAIQLVDCESKFVPSRIQYTRNSPPSVDRGMWQFNSYWQKRVSDECAFDPVCSTREAIKMLKAGQANLWSCYWSSYKLVR
jgi:hypothetical protein